MLTEAPALDQTTKVGIANTIFLNKDYKLKPSFVEKANTYYDADPQTRDFHDGQTIDVINQWASDHTEGLVKDILNESTFNPDVVSYLLNALYFKGAWANKFDKADTHNEPFNGSDVVEMMHQVAEFRYAANDTYQAVCLPYGNQAYQMTVFLPREDKTIGDVLAVLNSGNWQKWQGYYLVDLKLPRFEIDSDINLKAPLQQLGIQRAFVYTPDGFEDFCYNPTWIDLVKQSAKIIVSEEGTEAAAVTIIGDGATSIPSSTQFYLNRPFLYVISEQSTHAILFIGQYCGETTAQIGNTASTPYKTEATYNLAGQRLMTIPEHGIYIKNGKKIIK
jgi:serpin B